MTHISLGNIHAFIDGELVGDREREIEEHLDGCTECQQLLDRERINVDIVSGVFSSVLEVPAEILESLPSADEMIALAQAEESRVPDKPKSKAFSWGGLKTVRLPRFRPLVLSPQLQMAATVVLLFGGGWMLLRQGAPAGTGLPSPGPGEVYPSVLDALQSGDTDGQSDGLGSLMERLNTLEPRGPLENQQACDGGDMLACYNLGIMYRDGDGVTQDSARAATLFQRACDGGLEEACSRE
ncbi:MAG: hypothetical protein CME26_16040 [Gemmatimonadetes bacterium]|nr:hypothetical protein [Gemmatimonadota bacterium]|tara:strand:- start:1083 stop:1802 length:720 start_codon:yes stop_codon:yes gene_type:complete